MGVRRVDLIENFEIGGETLDLAIVQGETYQLSFIYPEDIRGALIFGQIRKKYAQDDNQSDPLVQIKFLPYRITEVENPDGAELPPIIKTIVTLQLDEKVTESLPYTDYQGQEGQIPDLTNCYIYDIELRFTTNIVKKLVTWGYVQVKPEVTIQ